MNMRIISVTALCLAIGLTAFAAAIDIPLTYERYADGNPKRDRVTIESLRAIKPGEELTYDYGITLEERLTPRLKKIWECRCGAPKCVGTMLRPKRRRVVARSA